MAALSPPRFTQRVTFLHQYLSRCNACTHIHKVKDEDVVRRRVWPDIPEKRSCCHV